MRATKTKSDVTLPVAIASTVPLLLLKLGVGFLRVKVKRRRGVRTFRKALVRGGMSRETANQFAADYEALGRIRTYLPGGLRLRPFPFRP